MHKVIEQLKDFLEKKEIRFEYDEQNNCLRVQFDGKNSTWRGRGFVSEKTGFNFYSCVPVKCPESRRKECAELLNHLNCNLGFGNFEMDSDDGEIRFRNANRLTPPTLIDGSSPDFSSS